MNTIRSLIEINRLLCKVKLGYSAEERLVPQDVEVSFRIFFQKLPTACYNDNLADTFCYYTISTKISQLVNNKEFQLIEHLCFEIYNLLKEFTKKPIWVRVNKCNPPVENLLGGATFEIQDE